MDDQGKPAGRRENSITLEEQSIKKASREGGMEGRREGAGTVKLPHGHCNHSQGILYIVN